MTTSRDEIIEIADEVSVLAPHIAVRLRAIADRVRIQERYSTELAADNRFALRLAEDVATEHLRRKTREEIE